MDYRAGPGSGSSQMWIPLECAFSLIVQPLKGLTAPPAPSIRLCLCYTPARERAARGGLPPFPQLAPEQPQPGPRPARWGAALSSSLVRGAGEREVSAHPPSFFLGPGTGGQREKLWKTH